MKYKINKKRRCLMNSTPHDPATQDYREGAQQAQEDVLPNKVFVPFASLSKY
jgi:hypothetical protein